MEDIEVSVHITWDTNGEEVTHKEKEINIEKVTKDYYKLNMSAEWLEDISKNDTITLKVCIILFGNVNYYYAMCTIIFRLLLQLNWREKEDIEESLIVTLVWLFQLHILLMFTVILS